MFFGFVITYASADMKNYQYWCQNVLLSIKISPKFISSNGSNNGLVPTRRQAITQTSDDYFTDAYMRHLASMS